MCLVSVECVVVVFLVCLIGCLKVFWSVEMIGLEIMLLVVM